MQIYLLLCEVTDTETNDMQVWPYGYSTNYEDAKKALHKWIENDIANGEIPEDAEGDWYDEEYEDFYTICNDTKKWVYYVSEIDEV